MPPKLKPLQVSRDTNVAANTKKEKAKENPNTLIDNLVKQKELDDWKEKTRNLSFKDKFLEFTKSQRSPAELLDDDFFKQFPRLILGCWQLREENTKEIVKLNTKQKFNNEHLFNGKILPTEDKNTVPSNDSKLLTSQDFQTNNRYREALETILQHLEIGVRCFDSTDAYGGAEELLAEAVSYWKKEVKNRNASSSNASSGTSEEEKMTKKSKALSDIQIFTRLDSRHLEKAHKVVEFSLKALKFGNRATLLDSLERKKPYYQKLMERENIEGIDLLQYAFNGDAGDYTDPDRSPTREYTDPALFGLGIDLDGKTSSSGGSSRQTTSSRRSNGGNNRNSKPRDKPGLGATAEELTPEEQRQNENKSHLVGFLEPMRILHHLKKTSRIKQIGLSNFDTDRCREMLLLGCQVRTNQIQFSMIDRRAEFSGLLKLCREFRVKLLIYGALMGGWLTDRFLNCKNDPMPRLKTRDIDEGGVNVKGLGNRKCTASLLKYRQGLDLWMLGDWKPRTTLDGNGWDLFQELLKVLDQIAKEKTELWREELDEDRTISLGQQTEEMEGKQQDEKTADGTSAENETLEARAAKQIVENKPKFRISIAHIAILWAMRKIDTLAYGGAVIIGARDCRWLHETKILLKLLTVKGDRTKGENSFNYKYTLSDQDMEKIEKIYKQGAGTYQNREKRYLNLQKSYNYRPPTPNYHEKSYYDRERTNVYGRQRQLLEDAARRKDRMRVEEREEMQAEYQKLLDEAEAANREEEERKKKEAIEENDRRKAEIQLNAMKMMMAKGKNIFAGMKLPRR
ncbi:unnamed protein product [Amoebophrya sp. A120]|nr:unnamed protein product [Amoebophrya sp. A120]|eukprot:GSA120T00009816001.1